MALILHRGDSPSALVEQLGELLASDPLDVFERELVITPSPGVERWLGQLLAHALGATLGDDGVCAGLDVHTPHSFMSYALGRESDDPWHPDRLAWLVLSAMDDAVSRPGFEALAHHLGADTLAPGEDAWEHRARRSRRYAVARRLAGLFVRYCDERPRLVRAWEDGDDGGIDADLAWQPRLWRSVVERAIEAGALESPIQRLDRVTASLRDGSLDLGLPRRLNFFGYTRVPTALLDLLDALGARHQVHLWLPHPSEDLWNRIRESDPATGDAGVANGTGSADSVGVLPLRADDDSASLAEHPLLATLARDVRELELTLLARDVEQAPGRVEAAPGDSGSSPTLLHQLQADIRANRPPDGLTALTERTSIQIHACHGAARQVDALREILLGLIDENEGRLQPRDIVVMCPDIETYAPLIKAAFAASDEADVHHPGRRLRVQLADRGVAATNPLADVALRLVTLVTGRVRASDVLDFAELPAVRERFDFDTDDLEKIAAWIRTTGARWGLDADHRAEYQLGGLENNTWSLALDRLALGVTMAADSASPAATLLPVDDIGSSDIETASSFVTMMSEITAAAHAIRGTSASNPALPRATFTAPEWFAWLRRYVTALAAPAADALWQASAFERELGFLEAGSGGSELRVTDVRLMLEQRWGPRPSRSNFRNGAVSVCTLTPMRSVPHKAVILLGMDDESFPRSHVVDGDDVLARHPRVGERDPRSEDRQLLLDAVMAATDHVIALYSGFDERDGTRRPPAVPLQELIAAAEATGAGRSLVRDHPLQPFDERNFTARSPLDAGSYDRAARDGAEALRGLHRREASSDPRRHEMTPTLTPLLDGLLPDREPTDLTVDELVRFLENPARAFLAGRLQSGVTYEADEVENALPIAPGPLELWAVGDRMLRRALAGIPLDRVSDEEARGGSLPPQALASQADAVTRQVAGVLAGLPPGTRESVDVDVRLTMPWRGPASDPPQPPRDHIVRLTGVIPHVIGDEIQVVNYGSVSARHLARAWVALLAVSAAHPERPWSAAVHGKYGQSRLVAPDDAVQTLTDLAILRQEGLRAPLPAPAKTSLAFAEGYLARWRRSNGNDADARDAGARKARPVWEGTYDRSGERDDAWWSRVFEPERPSLERLNVGNVFIDRSRRLWTPLLDNRSELGR